MRWIEPVAGTLLMVLVLADVFLTVLYARAGTGIISDRLARLGWLALRKIASACGNSRVLSFCGPFIVVALLLTWSFLLALGAALIVHPLLGSSIANRTGVLRPISSPRFTSPAAASPLSAAATSRRKAPAQNCCFF